MPPTPSRHPAGARSKRPIAGAFGTGTARTDPRGPASRAIRRTCEHAGTAPGSTAFPSPRCATGARCPRRSQTSCQSPLQTRSNDDGGRLAFMTALANRTGEELAENRARLLGEPDAAAIKSGFIDLLNRRTAEYADFGHGPDGPDFAFLRYFATVVAELMPEKDRRWTWDQVIAIEGPEAASSVAKAVKGLFDETPRRPRRTVHTEG